MKSFILKIFLLAGILTLLISKFHDSSVEVNEYFSNLFYGNHSQNFTDKGPFLASVVNNSGNNPIQTPGLNPTTEKMIVYDRKETLFSDFYLQSSKASIAGTSTLQPWKSEITQIQFAGALLSKNNKPEAIKDGKIKIPVLGIISEDGSMLTHKTHQAFNANQFPDITYFFDNARIKMNHSDSVFINTTGNLSIAGVTRKVALEAKGKRLKNGTFHLNINKKLRMTDFNIYPPSLLLGTIKSGNVITLDFELELGSSLN
jgi:polyisoprenoid-binding protein YceI